MKEASVAMQSRDRTPFPPDPNPRKPRMQVPPGAWDTHFHAYGPPQIYPYSEGRHHTPCAAPIEHYFGVAGVLGFERGVCVQSKIMGDEDIRVTLDAVQKSDGRLRAMVRSWPEYTPDDIRRLHAAGVRGMRFNLVKSLDGAYHKAYFDKVVSLAATKNWVIALHVDTESIHQVADVIRRMPLPTIIENYVKMDARLGVDQPTLRVLCDLAKEPHVWIKTASAYKMIWRGATYEQVVPIARAVAAAAPDRLIWGSDWPHSGAYQPGKMFNDGDLVDWLVDFVPDEAARHKMLVENPKRLFDFD
jgi:predicted TIM-barrel fold metal-dependent hydrolase